MTRQKHLSAFLISLLLIPGGASAWATGGADNSPDGLPTSAEPIIKPSETGPEKSPPASWKRLPEYIWQDQKAMWIAPFRPTRSNAKWFAVMGAAAAGLIATDRWTSRQLPNSRDQIAAASRTSQFGAMYSMLPLSAVLYLWGGRTNNEHLRETGLLAFEALADAVIVTSVIKTITQRQRPMEGGGGGQFFAGSGRLWNSGASFPSGHAMQTWALASVIAHEYPRPWFVPAAVYGLAGTVSASRFAARRHFASDIVVGAAIGWLVGEYVYRRRHNPDFERSKPAMAMRILNHVHFGSAAELPPGVPGPWQAQRIP